MTRTLALFALTALLAPLAAAEGESIEWQKDLPAATKLAEETGRPLVLYFTFGT
jgi:hypothetical protein